MPSAPDGGKRPTAVDERTSSLLSHPLKGLNYVRKGDIQSRDGGRGKIALDGDDDEENRTKLDFHCLISRGETSLALG